MEIVHIEEIDSKDIVYDLETKAGTFLAGSLESGLMVKNTDSCYVKFPINRDDYKTEEEFMTKQFHMAEECAEYCSNQFKRPIELEFEKYMYPFALFTKKRYAYQEWTSPYEPNEGINYKGIQVVRRDTCKYVKEEMSKIFKIIMSAKNSEDARKKSLVTVKNSIENLVNDKIDEKNLILSKQLKSRYIVRKNNKSVEYNWNGWPVNTPIEKKIGLGPYYRDIIHPHVRLAQQIMLKDPANHPKPPDRVPYLFEEKEGASLQCDKVIHPNDFVKGVNKIDSLYYFERQFKKPIDMIFSLMMEDTGSIYRDIIIKKINKQNKQSEITNFINVTNNKTRESEEIKEIKEIKECKKKVNKDTIKKNTDIRNFFSSV
jgi:DNA polymerase delta subunit 1